MKEKLLIIEAHSDDSAISVGGFLEKYRDKYEYHFALVCASDLNLHHIGKVTRDQRLEEYKAFVNHFGGHFHQTELLPFDSESQMDTLPKKQIVKGIEQVIEKVKPETLIFQGPSFHHDHTLVYEATIAATRPTARFLPKSMFVMENPTYVHSLGPSTDFNANFYIQLSEEQLQMKLDNFRNFFPTQIREDENYLSSEGLKSWARYRGIESRCLYAEALNVFKQII